MKINEIIEAKIDNKNGWGAVPYNQDVDYFGLQVLMRPSTFIKLSTPLGQEHNSDIKNHIAGGGAIGAPHLYVNIPPAWEDGDFSDYASVTQHEGRNRCHAILKVEGDDPIEMHLFPSGGMRRRNITDDMINKLNQGVYIQSTKTLYKGPWFETVG